MPKLIAEDAVTRLSKIAGVTDFDDWQSQLEGADDRIRDQVHGSIAEAWEACLPTWIGFGRVRDLSRAIRVPKYWPSYANRLGRAFAQVYRDDYCFLVSILRAVPIESYEYLCAYDLLEMIACEFYRIDDSITEEIRSVDLPIPPVVRVEIDHDRYYVGITTAGEAIYQSCLIEYGDEDEDG